jgi:hypothetical protein
MKSIKFNVNVYNAGSENERITISSPSTIWLSAEKSPAPVKGEAEALEKEFFRLTKSCDKVTLKKDKNKKHSESELCNAVFDDYVKECAAKNAIYDEIKSKVYGLGIDQKEVNFGDPELDIIKQKINDINKNFCWKIDPSYCYFRTGIEYMKHINNLKLSIETVQDCIDGECAGAVMII